MSPTPASDGRRFDEVLEDFARDAMGETDEPAAASYRGRIVLECLLQQAGQAAQPSHETLTELYVESSRQPARADYAAVAEELGLRPGLAPRHLVALRRAFALANHPDRVPPAQREEATRRMAIANILIDRALGEIRGSA